MKELWYLASIFAYTLKVLFGTSIWWFQSIWNIEFNIQYMTYISCLIQHATLVMYEAVIYPFVFNCIKTNYSKNMWDGYLFATTCQSIVDAMEWGVASIWCMLGKILSTTFCNNMDNKWLSMVCLEYNRKAYMS